MLTIIRKLAKDSKGATAIEYGLIAALVSVAAITAWTSMGTNLKTTVDKVATQLAQ